MRTLSNKSFKFLLFRRKQNSFLYVRLCSRLNNPKRENKDNPFKKRPWKQPIKVENESRIANRICVTVLGNGGIGQPRCVGLFTDLKSYLFNCGEGVGRYCREYNINTCLIKHVFITQRKWENISGLSDIYITNQTSGVYSMYLYGPPDIEQFKSILISSKPLDTKLIKKEEANYIDHTMNIEHIRITAENGKQSVRNSYDKRFCMKNHSDVVYSYICKIFKKPGDFLVEKCVEYGVPIGPQLLKLKNGESIELQCGKTVYAKDVHGPFYPGGVILIVDCPSEAFMEAVINEKKFEAFQLPLNTSPEVFAIFHFTPSHIFNSTKYQNWINRFHQNTQHYALNSDCPVTSSKVIHQTQKYLNILHPNIFSKLRDEEVTSRHKIFATNNIIYPLPMTQIYIRPEKKFEWFNVVNMDADSVNVAVDGTDIVTWSSETDEKLKDLKSALQKKLVSNAHVNKLYPEIAFLGTSSATSTAYRNVSAILVNTSSDNSILLDCGEGTSMQLVRCYGSDFSSVLRKISCIFISHLHVDHYMGLFELVLQRLKAFRSSPVPYRPIILILPSIVRKVFQEFCNIFENLYPVVKIYRCKSFEMNNKELEQYLGNIKISTVPVVHCADAHGIVIESRSEWKIVYSGDTAPSQKLIDSGKDCTLLIHEASIDDNLVNEAVSKMHCTPTQVIDVAEKMNAQYTIMTHFSKRYLPVPVTPECNTREVGYAYDFMKVRMCDLPLLPLFTPVIKCLFKEDLKTNIEKGSSISSFENVFIKVLKS